ncbi:hypothetical protein CR513_11994, partial [Mucuna pruriens]
MSTRRSLGDNFTGIVLQANADMQLTTYCDLDWASCPFAQRSLPRYMVFLNSSPILWKTKKHHIGFRSFT